MQRVEEQAEGVGNDRCEADHHANEGSRSYLPSGEVDGGFFVHDRGGGAHGCLRSNTARRPCDGRPNALTTRL
jgi:hypothetical protein